MEEVEFIWTRATRPDILGKFGERKKREEVEEYAAEEKVRGAWCKG